MIIHTVLVFQIFKLCNTCVNLICLNGDTKCVTLVLTLLVQNWHSQKMWHTNIVSINSKLK